MVEKDIDEPFSADRFVNYIHALALDAENVNIELWIAHLYECTRLFKSMGKSMSLAFQGSPFTSISIQTKYRHNRQGRILKL
jgi:hypothetical protein